MKYMKLGTRPDIFYTEEATRTVVSDVPSDIVIKVDNTTFLLHKLQHQLLSKCGLLRSLCSGPDDSSPVTTLHLRDIPGGRDAFELCAKFCYGITVNVGANNFVSAFCAAKFLRMTETVANGNLVSKLETFFSSCILQGWKDSLVTLQSTATIQEWSENLGIIRRCIDSIVEKITTPPSKVKWSYTYTRRGYNKELHQCAPKDWFTEDISGLNIDIFRAIITTLRSTNLLVPQLIGESLHVYACRWIPISNSSRPGDTSASQNEAAAEKDRRVLVETIVSLIPAEKGSVSVGFLIRLLNIANVLRVSPMTKAELVRRTSQQLEEATVNDLLLPPTILSQTRDTTCDHIDLIMVVLESFLEQQRRRSLSDDTRLRALTTVGKLIDAYLLHVVARGVNVPVTKIASLVEALPAAARPMHDELYKAINVYLKEHPDLTKGEKKQLCRALDCKKLSPEARAHVVKNEQLPLRTVVQVLFFEQERGARPAIGRDQRELQRDQELIIQASSSTSQMDNKLLRRGPDNTVLKEDQDHSSTRLNHDREKGIMKEARRREAESRRGKEIEEIHRSKSETKGIKQGRISKQ
ncbi:hypothetical protein Dimus_035056 [Dionaea muscipula]